MQYNRISFSYNVIFVFRKVKSKLIRCIRDDDETNKTNNCDSSIKEEVFKNTGYKK
jgi:hypothetical protein